MAESSVNNLSEKDIQAIILEILTGERIIRHQYSDLPEILEEILIFKYPTAVQRQYYDMFESIALERAIGDGLLLEEDISEDIIEAFFSTEDMEELCDLEKKVEGLTLLLKKRIKGTDLYKRDEQRIEEIKGRISELESKKSITSQFTAEHQSREDTYFELLAECTYDRSGTRKWSSSEELLNALSTNDAYSLLRNFLDFYWGQATEIIRKVARSGQWRNMYLSAEKGAGLTDKPTKDSSAAYLRLMSWSQYYNNIMEIPLGERPPNHIIEDDAKLDEYIERYQDKVEAESKALAKKRGEKKGSLSASDKDQVVVTAESKNYVSLHKSGEYSDTEIISGRVSEDGNSDSSYSEIRERQMKSKQRASKRRERLKKSMGDAK